jgi:antitoxin component YwqK of YwqJK toxin-antitoxin module
MKKLIYSCVIYILGAFHFTAQTTIQETKLNSINGVLSLNNEPYSGHVVSIIFGGEIKSSYDVIQGFIEGTVEEYFETPNYNASLYKDTSKINYWNLENKSQKNELLRIDSDSIKFTQELTDFINYKIGGQKKLEKLSSKNSEGKLKEKNKVLYDQYLQFEKNRSILSKQKMQLLNNNIALQIQIEKEINKPLYSPVIQTKYNMVKSVKSGFYKQYSPKGLTVTEGQYSNGKQEGLWTYNFPNGNIKAQGNFKNGDGRDTSDIGIPRNGREGKWTIQYENGNKSEVSNYTAGELDGVYNSFYENSKPKEVSNYKVGVRDGLYTSFFENGNKVEVSNYKDGKLDGLCTVYNGNGKPERVSNYKAGKLDGLCTVYNGNGKPGRVSNYKAGKLEGLETEYNDLGLKASEINYSDDRQNGKSTEYKNGVKSAEYQYIKGKMHGPFVSYFENGKIYQKGMIDSTYLQNNGIKEYLEYNEDGSINAHKFFNEDGTEKKPKVALNSAGLNKSYKCKCCKATINGIKNGYDDKGREYSTSDFEYMQTVCSWTGMDTDDFVKSQGFSNIYDYYRDKYKYCTLKCVRTCY